MNRAALWISLISIAGYAAARAEIIDRIAVSVGNRVITSSEIERHARLTAFLNHEQPDLSPAGRRNTAERLVEQKLVGRELEAARYPAPAAAEAEPAMKGLREHYKTPAALKDALAQYGITEQQLREHLLWQLRFLRFIDLRFRPGVQVTEEEAREYFEKTVRPVAGQANPAAAPSFDEYRERIEQALTGQRVDQDLNRWLELARRRTRVEYREEAFQ